MPQPGGLAAPAGAAGLSGPGEPVTVTVTVTVVAMAAAEPATRTLAAPTRMIIIVTSIMKPWHRVRAVTVTRDRAARRRRGPGP